MATFTYTPDRGFIKSTDPIVLTAQFGDGYSQTTADLINNYKESWTLSFKNRETTTINEIVSFFIDNDASYSEFLWTPTGETEEIKVLASKWKKSYVTDDISSLSVTFTRVYR